MAKQKSRRRNTVSAPPTPFEQARDELFQHVIRCGVIGAASEHQSEWFDATMDYLTDRYQELSSPQLKELRTLGERFAQPAKGKGPEIAEPAVESQDATDVTESADATESASEDAVTTF